MSQVNREKIDTVRYNIFYTPNPNPELDPIPSWVREEKSYNINNTNDITGKTSTGTLKFTTSDLNSLYPENVNSYNHFDDVNTGPEDQYENPIYIDIDITNTTINLLLRDGSISHDVIETENNKKIWWFNDEYVIPNDHYHNRGRHDNNTSDFFGLI
jgi:hypothetical protein